MKKFKFLLLSAVVTALTFTSCKDENVTPKNPPSNETELITTMKIILNDSGTNQFDTFTFRDLDGPGGNNPNQFDTIRLMNSKKYLCKILLLDESKSDVDTVSNEVLEEGDDHMFFFKATNNIITVTYKDLDSKSIPIGLESLWKTNSSAANGSISVTLKHQPGVKDGTETPGEADASVEFPVQIK